LWKDELDLKSFYLSHIALKITRNQSTLPNKDPLYPLQSYFNREAVHMGWNIVRMSITKKLPDLGSMHRLSTSLNPSVTCTKNG
jgi:hypothetical protein